jgi:TRAP-type mannitol/chloroaromatic compound transport system permease large subunit
MEDAAGIFTATEQAGAGGGTGRFHFAWKTRGLDWRVLHGIDLTRMVSSLARPTFTVTPLRRINGKLSQASRG